MDSNTRIAKRLNNQDMIQEVYRHTRDIWIVVDKVEDLLYCDSISRGHLVNFHIITDSDQCPEMAEKIK